MLLTRSSSVNTSSIQSLPKFIQDLKQIHVLFQQASGELVVADEHQDQPSWHI
jgi:hypothetical protein